MELISHGSRMLPNDDRMIKMHDFRTWLDNTERASCPSRSDSHHGHGVKGEFLSPRVATFCISSLWRVHVRRQTWHCVSSSHVFFSGAGLISHASSTHYASQSFIYVEGTLSCIKSSKLLHTHKKLYYAQSSLTCTGNNVSYLRLEDAFLHWYMIVIVAYHIHHYIRTEQETAASVHTCTTGSTAQSEEAKAGLLAACNVIVCASGCFWPREKPSSACCTFQISMCF